MVTSIKPAPSTTSRLAFMIREYLTLSPTSALSRFNFTDTLPGRCRPSCFSWVMRDLEGTRPTPLWPYFKREQDISSLRKGDIIPVNSCWNGMTAFDAKWFLPNSNHGTNSTQKPGVDDGPIRFRAHPQCLVSECLLTSYDIHVRSKQHPTIFVNPKAVASKCPNKHADMLASDQADRSESVSIISSQPTNTATTSCMIGSCVPKL